MTDSLRLFPVAGLPAGGAAWNFDERLAHHLNVLRKRAGDRIILFDAQGRQAIVEIESIQPQRVQCKLVEFRKDLATPRKLSLVLALAKGKHFETALRMAVELGVYEIRLLSAQRSVPKWDVAQQERRLDRVQAIAAEAARQSELARIPRVLPPTGLEQLLISVPNNAQRILCSARKGVPMPAPVDGTREAWIAVGPEGDFSEQEEHLFEQSGFICVSLGPTVLRVDTAVAAALAIMIDRTYWQPDGAEC